MFLAVNGGHHGLSLTALGRMLAWKTLGQLSHAYHFAEATTKAEGRDQWMGATIVLIGVIWAAAIWLRGPKPRK